jgi:hypothetical protein
MVLQPRSSAGGSTERIPVDRKNGWLLFLVEVITDGWLHYWSIGCWVPVFHFPIPATSTNQCEIRLVQDNIRHDACWLILSATSVACFFSLDSHPPSSPECLAAFAYSTWRALDLFALSLRLPVFGLKNSPDTNEKMDLHRIQRRFILSLMHLVELIFNYAVIYWMLSYKADRFKDPLTLPAHALQLSFSTLTTIGYGTYAPVSRLSTAAAMLESLTGLLWIGGIIAKMVAGSQEIDFGEDEYKTASRRQLQTRKWLPPIATLGTFLSMMVVAVLCVGPMDWNLVLRGIAPLFRLIAIMAGAFVALSGLLCRFGIKADRSDRVE